jgi:hypothetical protein
MNLQFSILMAQTTDCGALFRAPQRIASETQMRLAESAVPAPSSGVITPTQETEERT